MNPFLPHPPQHAHYITTTSVRNEWYLVVAVWLLIKTLTSSAEECRVLVLPPRLPWKKPHHQVLLLLGAITTA